jgi:hypothetical protein
LHVCFWCKQLGVLYLYKSPGWTREWFLHAKWSNSKELSLQIQPNLIQYG